MVILLIHKSKCINYECVYRDEMFVITRHNVSYFYNPATNCLNIMNVFSSVFVI